MFLFFHMETNGLPKSWKAPHTDTQNWPEITKIAWGVYDKFGDLLTTENHTINEKDNNLPLVLQSFSKAILDNKYVISHNFEYHSKVLGSSFLRQHIEHKLFFAESFCTMQEGTYFCGIRGRYGKLKWPKLDELYSKIFNQSFDKEDSPLCEVKATAACLFALVKMEEIDIF